MPSLFDLARRRPGAGMDSGINQPKTLTLGMPGNTAGPSSGGGGYGTNAGGKYSADTFGGNAGGNNFGGVKTNGGGMFGGLGSNLTTPGSSWTNSNNPLSGGLLGKLPAGNMPTGWANGVPSQYMNPVVQGGTGGALPGAINQWMNNPALIQAREAFQMKMKADMQRQFQEQMAGATSTLGPMGAPSPEMQQQTQAYQQFKGSLSGKSNQEIDAMYEQLVQEAGLNKNTPANALTNMKMQALRDYGSQAGFDNWLSPEQKQQKFWANGTPW